MSLRRHACGVLATHAAAAGRPPLPQQRLFSFLGYRRILPGLRLQGDHDRGGAVEAQRQGRPDGGALRAGAGLGRCLLAFSRPLPAVLAAVRSDARLQSFSLFPCSSSCMASSLVSAQAQRAAACWPRRRASAPAPAAPQLQAVQSPYCQPPAALPPAPSLARLPPQSSSSCKPWCCTWRWPPSSSP